jgi:hypothetical protein
MSHAESNKLLAELVNSTHRTLDATVSRGLVDAQGCSAVTDSHHHTEAVEAAAARTTHAGEYNGKYTMHGLRDRLSLTLPVSQLVAGDRQPKFRKMVQALDDLRRLGATPNIAADFASIIDACVARVEQQETLFHRSHVDVDALDHDDFLATVAALSQCVADAVETSWDQFADHERRVVTEYEKNAAELLRRYDAEALLVSAASPTRLRASRPADDLEPWQEASGAARAERTYETRVIQRIEENYRNDAVSAEYDEEWYRARRGDVATLLPRAERVGVSLDDRLYDRAYELLTKLCRITNERYVDVADRVEKRGIASARTMEELSSRRQGIEAAGVAFQEGLQEHRIASEGDMVKLTNLVGASKAADAEAAIAYEKGAQQSMEYLTQTDAQVVGVQQQICALQQQLVQLTDDRRLVGKDVVDAADREAHRAADHAALIASCDHYLELLERSRQSYLLPAGYSAVLADFAGDCRDLVAARFRDNAATLDVLHRQAVDRYANVQATAYIAPVLMKHRLTKKVDDLQQKVELSKKQREFCTNTLDPNRDSHLEAEEKITAMVAALQLRVPKLEADAQRHRAAFAEVLPWMDKFELPVPFRDIEALARENVEACETLIVRASRPPIVNLDFAAAARVVVPAKAVDAVLVERAQKAQNIVRTFK